MQYFCLFLPDQPIVFFFFYGNNANKPHSEPTSWFQVMGIPRKGRQCLAVIALNRKLLPCMWEDIQVKALAPESYLKSFQILLRAIKHQLTCALELTSGGFLIGRRRILVSPGYRLVCRKLKCLHFKMYGYIEKNYWQTSQQLYGGIFFHPPMAKGPPKGFSNFSQNWEELFCKLNFYL